MEQETPDEFAQWFAHNYPRDTLIYDPHWHAPRIYRAALSAARRATEAAAKQGAQEPVMWNDLMRTGVGALCHPGDRQTRLWMLMFDDAERRGDTAIFTDEAQAKQMFANAEGRGWNCHLFVSADRTPAAARDVQRDAERAIADIAAERKRQVSAEGWTPEHDDEHADGSLAMAASCYAVPPDRRETELREDFDGNKKVRTIAPQSWPWAGWWWKPKDRRRDLVRAGALIVAEIERLDRAAHSAQGEAGGVGT